MQDEILINLRIDNIISSNEKSLNKMDKLNNYTLKYSMYSGEFCCHRKTRNQQQTVGKLNRK